MKCLFLFLVLFVPFVSALSVDFVVSDHLGSPTAVICSQGSDGCEQDSERWRVDYEPFGATFDEVGENRHQYNAKELDGVTGLHFFGARYLDAGVGRFGSADEVLGRIEAPQELNRYAYVINNPLGRVDPTGNQGISTYVFGKFFLTHPGLLSRANDGSLTLDDKKTVLDWASSQFSDNKPLSVKYFNQYTHPEKLVGLPKGHWQKEPELYPVYDVSSEWEKFGFDDITVGKVLRQAANDAKHPNKIRELYESGDKALLLVDGHMAFSPNDEFESVGKYYYSVQKKGGGVAILSAHDIYDWRRAFDNGDNAKVSEFHIPKIAAKLLGSFGYSVTDYSIVVPDAIFEDLGTPYIMEGEWEVSESLLYDSFGWDKSE